MIDQKCLNRALEQYKRDFVSRWEGGEIFKWQAVKWFQDNWDLNAPNFGDMLDRALDHTESLLVSRNTFPRGMIVEYAMAAPEEVRSMFADLFDQSKDVYGRINEFKRRVKEVHKKVRNDDKSDYQDENTITTYLWLRYPDEYYIYKYGEVRAVISTLHADTTIKRGDGENNLRNFFPLYDELNAALKKDAELVQLFQSHLNDTCYPDPELKTLTIDVGFYISRSLNEPPVLKESSTSFTTTAYDENCQYWWLNANPKIWRFSDTAVGDRQSYSLLNENGHKRRIYQNFLDAKAGDIVIGYESTPVKQIVGIARICSEQDGEKLEFEKVEGLTTPINFAAVKECPELENMEYLRNPQGSLFRLTEDEFDFIMDLIRDENPAPVSTSAAEGYSKARFLDEVYLPEERYDNLVAVLRNKKNIILQGAPGVGKTFAARRLAWSMMGEKDDSRIEFIQFHQNYSYEDFVMGYKPVEDGFELKYGIFYQFCQKAANQPDKEFFFIIDEINRGNLSKIFGELLMLIERDYRGTKATLAYNGLPFSVPKNLYIIGMMNTADRSLAMIDYALRRRFSFFDIEPGFESTGFKTYKASLKNKTLDLLIDKVKELNIAIATDKSLGKGFCIGHSYFCGMEQKDCTDTRLHEIVDYDILPMLNEYWFDEQGKYEDWKVILNGIF